MSSPLQGASGTLGNPGYCFLSDTKTGFYLSGTHQITFVYNGVAGLVLNSDGSASLGSGAFTCGGMTLAEIATPSPPIAGFMKLYAKSGDFAATQTSSGIEYLIGKDPTIQEFISGSGTYAPSTGTVRIRVRMTGGGGGGGAAATNDGSVGGTTTFGSWTALGGTGGAHGAASSAVAGGLGGVGGANGTGTVVVRNSGNFGLTGIAGTCSGAGAPGPFGGGARAFRGAGDGSPGIGYGSGGSGGYTTGTPAGGGGGGSGEYVEFYVSLPGSISYSVGTGGNGGLAGTQAGGNGAAGVIVIEEFYN